MTDQPVTPDREVLVRAVRQAIAEWLSSPVRPADLLDPRPIEYAESEAVVDALLPLLTEALDRARQQGRDEGRTEASEAIVIYANRRPSWTRSERFPYVMAAEIASGTWYDPLARGADRKADDD